MFVDGCLSCATLTGECEPPGGVIYDNPQWIVVMRARPLLLAGPAIMILKRHCEDFNALTLDELHTMSETMQHVSRAYCQVLQPQKVHFGLYGEGVKHIHLHVFPRTSNLPAGNIPLTYLRLGHAVLRFFRLKHPISDDRVAAVAVLLRDALAAH